EDRGDFETESYRPNCSAVGDADRHTAATLAGVKSDHGNERLGAETQSRQVALVERGRDAIAIHPRRPEFFEWSFCSAPYGNARVLQDFQSGIQHGAPKRTQIRGWGNPSRACAFEEIVAMPVFHGDDVQVAIDVIFGVEELREFADGQSVANR